MQQEVNHNGSAVTVPDYSDPLLYVNRELSWIYFNQRVLDEALK
ncbi:MAG: hypothetical protein HGA77_11315, partial [Chlorobiaceae bacterium]|nr:hypothetical protein [Chlorobiaceae bacterium]